MNQQFFDMGDADDNLAMMALPSFNYGGGYTSAQPYDPWGGAYSPPFQQAPSPVPTFTPQQSSGHSTRDSILQTINYGIASFAKNVPQTPIYNATGQHTTTTGGAHTAQEAATNVTSAIGAGAGGVLDSIANSLGVRPTTVLIGGGALLLTLFMKPPRRRY